MANEKGEKDNKATPAAKGANGEAKPATPGDGGQSDATPEASAAAPPAGFDINVSRSKGDGWMVKEKGNTTMGRLLGRFEFEGDDNKVRAFYQVKTHMETKCIVGTGDDAEEKNLPAGSVVNIDESKALEDLANRSVDGGVYDVWLQYGEKEKGKRGRSGFWPATVKLKMVKPPQMVAPIRRRSQEVTDDDTPF